MLEWFPPLAQYAFFFPDISSSLVYATTHSNITIMDIRTMHVPQTMTNPQHYGPITCLCIDRKRTWLVAGTTTGVLSLWDLRFGLHLRSWHVRGGSGGRKRIHQCVIHPTKGKGRWIMVAVETSRQTADLRALSAVVEVWDVENGVLVESFVTRTASSAEPVQEPQEVPGVDAEASPAVAMAALVRSVEQHSTGNERRGSKSGDELIPPPAPAPDVRAMVVGSDFGGYSGLHRLELGDMADASARSAARGFMITASEDKKIRLWDFARLERTSILSGLEEEHERPAYRCVTLCEMCVVLFQQVYAPLVRLSTGKQQLMWRLGRLHLPKLLIDHHRG